MLIFKRLLKKIIYCKANRLHIGTNVKFNDTPRFTIKGNGRIEIGDNVNFGTNCDLRSYEGSLLTIEDHVKIDDGVRIIAANSNIVRIKTGSKIGFYSILNGGGGISFGPNSSTYGFVYIQSSKHENNGKNFERNKFNHQSVAIGENVLIGPHSVINPGVSVDDNQTIKGHSVLGEY